MIQCKTMGVCVSQKRMRSPVDEAAAVFVNQLYLKQNTHTQKKPNKLKKKKNPTFDLAERRGLVFFSLGHSVCRRKIRWYKRTWGDTQYSSWITSYFSIQPSCLNQ